MRREGGEKLHANLKRAVRCGARMAYPHFGGHGVAVAIHLDRIGGIGRQRNRRKQEGAVFADVHDPCALLHLERAPQGPYDLEAHLRPSVSVPAHIPQTPFDHDRPRSICARAASMRLPPAS